MTGLPGLVDGRLRDLAPLHAGRLARALKMLNAQGEEARLVGGAVRDLVLGHPPGDFDVATTATPDVVMERARAAGMGVSPTGIAHGTVTLIVDGQPIETTTLRQDVATDGRHALVAFGRDFSADARRRDFTMNALSASPDGAVHDYVGGLPDLAERRVRFIGDARQRIREDFLRSLRFFRFSARYGDGQLDAEGFRAAIQERAGLRHLSRERVRAELMKLLAAPRAREVAAQLCDTGLLAELLAGATDAGRFQRAVDVEALRGSAPDPLLRLAALTLRITEDAERLAERLRLSNAEAARLERAAATLETLHGLAEAPPLSELQASLFQRGRVAALDALTLAHADAGLGRDRRNFLSAYKFLAEAPDIALPFTGADIVARGVAPGKKVGAILKRLQALWIRAGFPKEPERLARLLDEAMEGPGQRSHDLGPKNGDSGNALP